VNLGARVLTRRQHLKITQQELAKSLGVTPQHISLIEQDKATPSLTLLAGLAMQLGTTIDYLVTGNDGVITDTIPAIKADKALTVKAKKALMGLVEELHILSETAIVKIPSRDSDEKLKLGPTKGGDNPSR
jgi:transcriptional regulator with XRE-family HTH domain